MLANTPYLFACLVACCAVSNCLAQQDVKSFLAADVTDGGPQYQEVENAILAFRNNDAATARKLFLAAQANHPQLAPADVMLARLHRASGQNVLAQAALDRAQIDAADDPEVYLMLGDIAFEQSQMSFADVMFEKAGRTLTEFDRNKHRKRNLQIRAHAGLAAVAEARGQWKAAERQLASWIALDANNANAHGRWGRALFLLQQEDEARRAFRQQRELDATAPPPELSLARLYSDSGDKEQARGLIEAAAKAASDEPETLLAAAAWMLSDGQFDTATSYAQQVLNSDAESIAAMILLGKLARCGDDRPAAIKHLEAAVLRAPLNFEAKNQLALTLADSDRRIDLERSRQFAQLNTRSFANLSSRMGREAAVTYAWILFHLGRETEAESTIAGVLRSGAIGPESAYHAARILHDRGQSKLAAEILTPMLKVAPMFPARPDAESLLAKLAQAEATATDNP